MTTRRGEDDLELAQVELTSPEGATEDELSDVEGLLFHLGDELPLRPGVKFSVGVATSRELELLRGLLDQLEKASGL